MCVIGCDYSNVMNRISRYSNVELIYGAQNESSVWQYHIFCTAGYGFQLCKFVKLFKFTWSVVSKTVANGLGFASEKACSSLNSDGIHLWGKLAVKLCRYLSTTGHNWLRHCATSRKVAGSIPDGVTGIFHWRVSSGRTMYGPEVDSVSNRNEYHEFFLGGKGGRCVGLTTLPPSCADCL